VQITVLGKSPAWQDVDGACSGYLVREGDHVLLLDCGNGVFSKLRCTCDYVEVDTVLITHLHSDHFLDLIPYSYALRYAPRQQPVAVDDWPANESPARPRLFAPPGSGDVFRRISALFGAEELIETAFELIEYEPTETYQFGEMTVHFGEVPHYTLTFAVDITTRSGARMTYSADCRPNSALVDLARETDMLLIEATLPRPERTGLRGHLTAREAGEHGARAGARRLVVTHFSDELDPEHVCAEAAAGYGGSVELAVEGAVYAVGEAAASAHRAA
jgi:ribonuclease BN (tRNA processing enzyme)